jgi:hypothetical protein
MQNAKSRLKDSPPQLRGSDKRSEVERVEFKLTHLVLQRKGYLITVSQKRCNTFNFLEAAVLNKKKYDLTL